MERPVDDDQPARPEPEVGLADAGLAAEIARAAAHGRGADRTPTLEQLLAAFGEREPTDAARRRVAAALRVAGMGVRPDLTEAEPGQRLLLLPPGAAPGPARGRAVLGVVLIAVVLVVAAAAAALVNGGDDRASDSLPATQTTRFTPPTTPTTPAAAPTETQAVGAGTSSTSETTTATTTTGADDAAARDRAAQRRKQARDRAARRKRAAAARRRNVTVVVDASAAPTFLCADDGDGHQLYGGTLSGRQTFKARRVRLNVGLSSTVVTVDGNRVPLSGSPAGLDITRRGGAQNLPLGQRPCG